MRMIVVALPVIGVLVAAPAAAAPAGADRHYAAYEACIAEAAVRASYTEAAAREIVALTRVACADARLRALRERPERVEAADAQRATILPVAIDTLRDRRRTRDAMYGVPR